MLVLDNISQEELEEAIKNAEEWNQPYWVPILEDNLNDLKQMQEQDTQQEDKEE